MADQLICYYRLGCILFLIGVNWGGRRYEWTSAHVIAPIVVGAMLLVALGFYEAYAPLKYPMLPARFFRNVRGFTMLLVVCFVGGMLVRKPSIHVQIHLLMRAFSVLLHECTVAARIRIAFCSCRQADHRGSLRKYGVLRHDYRWVYRASLLQPCGA